MCAVTLAVLIFTMSSTVGGRTDDAGSRGRHPCRFYNHAVSGYRPLDEVTCDARYEPLISMSRLKENNAACKLYISVEYWYTLPWLNKKLPSTFQTSIQSLLAMVRGMGEGLQLFWQRGWNDWQVGPAIAPLVGWNLVTSPLQIS